MQTLVEPSRLVRGSRLGATTGMSLEREPPLPPSRVRHAFREPPLLGHRTGWQPADNDDYGDGGGRLLPVPAPQPHHPPSQAPFQGVHVVLGIPSRLPAAFLVDHVSVADCGCHGAQPSPRSPSTSSRRELATAALWCASCPAACAPGVPCGAAALTHLWRSVDTVDVCVGLLGLRQDHDAQACAPEPRRKARRRGRPLLRVVLAARCYSWQEKKAGHCRPRSLRQRVGGGAGRIACTGGEAELLTRTCTNIGVPAHSHNTLNLYTHTHHPLLLAHTPSR
jgi:hypothetical protein